MKLGTKSLLFGAHQFFLHPLTVVLAWRKLYRKWPTWSELLCIVVHDWGYWGLPNMDGPEGKLHPWFGARLAEKMLGREYFYLVLLHSRSLSKRLGCEPSKLCWADKLAIVYEPEWFYLLRTALTGELVEYRQQFAKRVPLSWTGSHWLRYVKNVELAADLKRVVNCPGYERRPATPDGRASEPQFSVAG